MAKDSEEIRWIDRIRAITFREVRDAGASFISRCCIAKYIKSDESFVKRNWNKNPYDCHSEKGENLGRPEVLSQESKDSRMQGHAHISVISRRLQHPEPSKMRTSSSICAGTDMGLSRQSLSEWVQEKVDDAKVEREAEGQDKEKERLAWEKREEAERKVKKEEQERLDKLTREDQERKKGKEGKSKIGWMNSQGKNKKESKEGRTREKGEKGRTRQAG
ncbi:uncharacterized protein [Macrobrachium rosenbergii]|uniref:uncharacterized protein n=1 Tax=Macrobrachium rosenbergii TaxID=79674 RepID=UPI0034D55125